MNITLNTHLKSLDSVDLPEDILEIIPSFNQRFIYFSNTGVYFSEINSPDSWDDRLPIKFSGTPQELFMWAKRVGENAIFIGTTEQVYLLTGTFVQLPDGFLDCYIRPLGVDFVPIGTQACVYSDIVIYMSAKGWRGLHSNGQSEDLTGIQTETLYQGELSGLDPDNLNRYGYGVVPIYIYPQLHYGCCIGRDKLWVSVPTITTSAYDASTYGQRIQVYDFIKKYWRPLNYNVKILTGGDDGQILGFFEDDKFIREIDQQFTKTLDEGGDNQSVDVLFPINDGGFPQNRKDPWSLKIKVSTGGSPLNIKVNDIELGSITSTYLREVIIDLTQISPPTKTFQVELYGDVADFILAYIIIDFQERPTPLTFYEILRQDFGEADDRKKRVRVWPFVIDTLGNTIKITPTVDGVVYPSMDFKNTDAGPRTFLYQFTQDVFGIDYSAKIEVVC